MAVALVMEMLPIPELMFTTFPPSLSRTPEAVVMAATLATLVLNTSIISDLVIEPAFSLGWSGVEMPALLIRSVTTIPRS